MIVGLALTVTLIALPVLLQPVVLLVTVSVPVYVAAAAPAGTVNTIGEGEGNTALVTLTKPAASAAAL